MSRPARSLKQLKERIDTLIEQQGEDAPVAAFIFTKEDVFVLEDNGEQVVQSDEIVEAVLGAVEDDYDYLYEEIFNCIDSEIEIQIKESESRS
jgi:dGTP triphosphohydrolase